MSNLKTFQDEFAELKAKITEIKKDPSNITPQILTFTFKLKCIKT